MALSQTDKKEVERIVKKEIQNFFNSSTLKQFENQMIDLIQKEIKKGKLRGDITEYISKAFNEFYFEIYRQRSMWGGTIKNLKL